MKSKKEIKVIVNFTPGWEERIAEASFKLYQGLQVKPDGVKKGA